MALTDVGGPFSTLGRPAGLLLRLFLHAVTLQLGTQFGIVVALGLGRLRDGCRLAQNGIRTLVR